MTAHPPALDAPTLLLAQASGWALECPGITVWCGDLFVVERHGEEPALFHDPAEALACLGPDAASPLWVAREQDATERGLR